MRKWKSPDKTENTVDTPNMEVLLPGEIDASMSMKERDYIVDARKKMSLLAGWSYDKQTQRELAKVAGEIAVNYLNGQKAVMLDKIASTVAIGKRENLKEFLKQAVAQDNELRTIADGAEEEMSNLMQIEVVEILKGKSTRIKSTTALYEGGYLEKEDFESALKMHRVEAESLIQNKFDRLSKITEGYMERFEKSLEGYKERQIQYHKGAV